MPLSRLYEEHEIAPELRHLYRDIRSSFDLPFVPSIFKMAAGAPDYLKLMWSDLGPVARSREFQAAAKALEEFAHSLTVSNGWCFADQERVLARQRFSSSDIEQFSAMAAMFVRAAPRLLLFTRLMQRGYSGGQPGRISGGKQPSAIAKLLTLHVPNEREAGLRVWLLYNDIRKTMGTRSVMSLFRVLSPFPPYLASVWVEGKKLLGQAEFTPAREALAQRALALTHRLPVRDHRAAAKHVSAAQWSEIQEMVDGVVRALPPVALLAAAWQRSFPHQARNVLAA